MMAASSEVSAFLLAAGAYNRDEWHKPYPRARRSPVLPHFGNSCGEKR